MLLVSFDKMRHAALRSTRKQSFVTVAVACIGIAPLAGHAQTVAPKVAAPPPAVVDASPRGEFRETFAAFTQDVERLAQDVAATMENLKKISGANVESRRAVVKGLGAHLTQLGASLQPDGPFVQSVDRYESWVSAQLARLNNERATLGSEFVEQTITRYKKNQGEVSKARELINTEVKAINATLHELTLAESRAAEMVLADDADEATRQLTATVQNIAKSVDAIRAQVRALGSPAA